MRILTKEVLIRTKLIKVTIKSRNKVRQKRTFVRCFFWKTRLITLKSQKSNIKTTLSLPLICKRVNTIKKKFWCPNKSRLKKTLLRGKSKTPCLTSTILNQDR